MNKRPIMDKPHNFSNSKSRVKEQEGDLYALAMTIKASFFCMCV